MKTQLLSICMLFCLASTAQTDTLASAVYSWSKAKPTNNNIGERRQVLNGSTLDLKKLEIHTTTLQPGKQSHAPMAYNDHEELVIVKDGDLLVKINGQEKLLGAGGLALIMAGDEQSVSNNTKMPVTYYVLNYTPKAPVDITRGKQGGGSLMIDWKDLKVIPTDKGESRPIFDTKSSVFPRFDVHATALNPGIASHPPHTHRAEEIILMIKGEGTMQLGDTFNKTTVGDVVLVNANLPHAIKNTGNVQCGYYAIQWHDQ